MKKRVVKAIHEYINQYNERPREVLVSPSIMPKEIKADLQSGWGFTVTIADVPLRWSDESETIDILPFQLTEKEKKELLW